MIFLKTADIIRLNEMLIERYGGTLGIRDEGALEGSIANCFQTFGGEELYPEIVDKIAVLTYSLCKNHVFLDGNKRVAIGAMLLILDLNAI
jgi:death-on-curing protein